MNMIHSETVSSPARWRGMVPFAELLNMCSRSEMNARKINNSAAAETAAADRIVVVPPSGVCDSRQYL